MKKILNKKTYGYVALFAFLCFFFYTQKSFIIDELFLMEENIKNIQTDIKIAEKRIATTTAKIEEIKAQNAQNIKEKVDIEAVKKKIKKQLKAYNLINQTVKVNLNSLVEQEKYLDAFVADFELVSAGSSDVEVAKTLDFLGLYGVVESYKGNKVVVYVDITTQVQNLKPIEEIKVVPQAIPQSTPQSTPIQPHNKNSKKIEPKGEKIVKDTIVKEKTKKPDTIITTPKKEIVSRPQNSSNITHNYLQNSFSTTFLNTPKNGYSINLLSSPSYENTLKLLKKTNQIDEAFVFSFGENTKQYKVMIGTFKDKNSADEAIQKLPAELLVYKPRAEKISIKQNLFHKYHTKN